MNRKTDRILDEYLVASARAGDRKAFGQLVDRWNKKMFLHAWHLTGDNELARDAVQDAWADIVRALPGLRDTVTFPAWCFRIVTRRCWDQIRKVRSQRKTSDAFAAEPHDDFESTTTIENRADNAPLQNAINELPPAQRIVVRLYYSQELSVAEVAAALSVPPGTVKTRLMHARKKLRASLEGDKTNA